MAQRKWRLAAFVALRNLEWQNGKEVHRFEDNVGWVYGKLGMRVWVGSLWLKAGCIDGSLHHGNEPRVPYKERKFVDRLGCCQRLKKDSAPWTCVVS
jgi:hypothetical protein